MNQDLDRNSKRPCTRSPLLLLLAVVFLTISPAGAVDLVNNGDFEAGFVPDGVCDLQEPDNDQLPLSWSCLETFSSALPEPSLLTSSPLNGPTAPGANSVKFFRGDRCHLSGDWTAIEQTINQNVTTCSSLVMNVDVMLVPMAPPDSHNLGGSGHVAGPCDPSGWEYPATVQVHYTDTSGGSQCWQYGWYQHAVTQAGRTDAGCISGFDGISAAPNVAVSQPIPTGVWIANAFDLLATLPGVQTIDRVRVGGSGWSFDSQMDNLQILCEEEVELCEQSGHPACDGECPPGMVCVEDPLGAPACVCEDFACEQSPWPQCGGSCPSGLVCVEDPSGGCNCEAPPCEQGQFPVCGGGCPPGTTCIPDIQADRCICEPLACEETFPECGGDCPPGTICGTDATGQCQCVPVDCEAGPFPECFGDCPPGAVCTTDTANGVCFCEVLACDQTYPACDGECPPSTICVTDPTGAGCFCEPLACEQTYPACDGDCPPSTICVSDPTGAGCFCELLACEQTYPACDGDCPPSTICVTDPTGTGCFCEPLPCEQTYPACDGDCPPSTICVADPTGAGCFCEPLPCEQTYPACDGDCPPNTVCVADPTGAGCFCEPLACEQTYPACDGDCPPGTICVTDPGGAGCFCEILACEQSPYPECGGECPPGTACVPENLTGECACQPLPCDQTYPVCDGDCPPLSHCESVAGAVVLPSPDLPPESNPPDCDQLESQYVGSGQTVYPTGVVLLDPVHRCFRNVQRTTDPASDNETQFFDSVLDALVDPGTGPVPVQLTGPVETVVIGKGSDTTGTWDTEIISMSLTGSVGGLEVVIRENPSLASPGRIAVMDLGGGLYHIDSFFDVFTELSVDGGSTFVPQLSAPTRMVLTPTAPTTCECMPDPCEQSPYPQCGGECPPGTECVPDSLTGECVCQPLPCDQTYPVCDGDCPPSTHCETVTGTVVLPAPDLPPESNPPDCDLLESQYMGSGQTSYPAGVVLIDPVHRCFQNVQRDTDPASGNETEIFESVLVAVVDPGTGPVPVQLTGPVETVVAGKGSDTTGTWDTEIVSMSLTGNVGGLVIEIRESPSLASVGQTAVVDLGGGLYHIDSFFDVFTELSVDGGQTFMPQLSAPVHMVLTPTASTNCECVPDLCEQSLYPQCGGECPPDEVCVAGPVGTGCVCEPIPCEQTLYPQCGGGCPPGTECIPDPLTGACRCVTLCSDMFFPECNGYCPPDEECVSTPGTDFCECLPQGPHCADTLAPECGGWCPPGERCDDLGGANFCECVACDVTPPGVIKGLYWLDHTILRWQTLPCAAVYNVYRLVGAQMPDLDSNGVADNYGSCLLPDLPIPQGVDPGTPALGLVHFYQVTGESVVGEGVMGWTSNGGPRPNLSPCP